MRAHFLNQVICLAHLHLWQQPGAMDEHVVLHLYVLDGLGTGMLRCIRTRRHPSLQSLLSFRYWRYHLCFTFFIIYWFKMFNLKVADKSQRDTSRPPSQQHKHESEATKTLGPLPVWDQLYQPLTNPQVISHLKNESSCAGARRGGALERIWWYEMGCMHGVIFFFFFLW